MSSRDNEAMKRQRQRGFEERVAAAPDEVLMLAAGGRVVLVHPLADEVDLLARLGIPTEQCTSVDGYWAIEDDVVFLQLSTATEGMREPGLYAALAPFPPRHVNLVAVVDVPLITRLVLEEAARDLLQVGWKDILLGENLTRLT